MSNKSRKSDYKWHASTVNGVGPKQGHLLYSVNTPRAQYVSVS